MKTDPLKLKPAITKPWRSLKRGDAYKSFGKLGKSITQNPGQVFTLPTLAVPTGLKLKFLDRAVDGTSRKMVKSTTFGSRYRTAWDAQDELFSTASTRHFITGLLNNLRRDQIADDVWQRWSQMVDLISTLRIPTKFSGFATSSSVMQHPTAVGEGYFSPLAVTTSHGTYDSDRVKYIGAALAAAEGQSLEAQFFAAARAAIEFSLNFFTAPVTASNVKPYSTKAAIASDDASLLEQIEARERIKDIYVQLGGNLRDLPAGVTETPEQSRDRLWQQGLSITSDDPFPVAPPSPRRARHATSSVQASAVMAPPLPVSTAPVSPLAPLAISTVPTVAMPTVSPSYLAGPLSSPPVATTLADVSGFPMIAPLLAPLPAAILPPLSGSPATLGSDLAQGIVQAAYQALSASPAVQASQAQRASQEELAPTVADDRAVASDPMELNVADATTQEESVSQFDGGSLASYWSDDTDVSDTEVEASSSMEDEVSTDDEVASLVLPSVPQNAPGTSDLSIDDLPSTEGLADLTASGEGVGDLATLALAFA
jgi:hypothetical protein